MFYPELPDVPVTYKAIKNIKIHDLNLHLSKLEWTPFLFVDDDFDIEQGLSVLTTNLHTTIDILAPDKTIKPKKTNYPWLNSELQLLKSNN